MTRQVLVSPRLPDLRSGNAALDAWVREHLQRYVAEVFEQISYLTPETNSFDLNHLGGSGTAGTYEIASQRNRYFRSGEFVFVSIHVTLAGSITGGGTGNLTIAGFPFQKVADHVPYGTAVFSGVNWTAGANLSCDFGTADEASSLVFTETNDDAAVSLVPVSAVSANDVIAATISYITNGVRTS